MLCATTLLLVLQIFLIRGSLGFDAKTIEYRPCIWCANLFPGRCYAANRSVASVAESPMLPDASALTTGGTLCAVQIGLHRAAHLESRMGLSSRRWHRHLDVHLHHCRHCLVLLELPVGLSLRDFPSHTHYRHLRFALSPLLSAPNIYCLH